jgi:hypothetical protein
MIVWAKNQATWHWAKNQATCSRRSRTMGKKPILQPLKSMTVWTGLATDLPGSSTRHVELDAENATTFASGLRF